MIKKDERIAEIQEHIAQYAGEIETLETIEKALKVYKGKMYDKRFQKASGFIRTVDYGYGDREIADHSLDKNRWDWKDEYELYIGNSTYIETPTRECKDVLVVVQSEIDKRKNCKAEIEKRLQITKDSDMGNARKKLIALRDSLNISEQLWRDLLDEFDVKYFKD